MQLPPISSEMLREILSSGATELRPNLSLNPDASLAVLTRRPLGAG
jgi:hypothetical protein